VKRCVVMTELALQYAKVYLAGCAASLSRELSFLGESYGAGSASEPVQTSLGTPPRLLASLPTLELSPPLILWGLRYSTPRSP
jgi:hypothetical protein